MTRLLASFDTAPVFSGSSPGSLDVAGRLDVAGVDSSLDMACSLDAAGSLAGSLVVVGSLGGADSLLGTEWSRTGDAEGEAVEEDAAKPPEVNAVERVVSVDCSEP